MLKSSIHPASGTGRQTPVPQTWTARLGNLPRDTRDTLFLLAVIGWVVLMQVGHIPWWCTALTAAVLTWRSVLTLRGQPLPGWAWRMGLLALTLAATWFSHGTLLGRDAGVTLIVVLVALKTLELRARRDAFVVFFLAFFTLLTHFFYSQSLLTAGGILIALLSFYLGGRASGHGKGRHTILFVLLVHHSSSSQRRDQVWWSGGGWRALSPPGRRTSLREAGDLFCHVALLTERLVDGGCDPLVAGVAGQGGIHAVHHRGERHPVVEVDHRKGAARSMHVAAMVFVVE